MDSEERDYRRVGYWANGEHGIGYVPLREFEMPNGWRVCMWDGKLVLEAEPWAWTADVPFGREEIGVGEELALYRRGKEFKWRKRKVDAEDGDFEWTVIGDEQRDPNEGLNERRERVLREAVEEFLREDVSILQADYAIQLVKGVLMKLEEKGYEF